MGRDSSLPMADKAPSRAAVATVSVECLARCMGLPTAASWWRKVLMPERYEGGWVAA